MPTPEPRRWTEHELITLATSGATKVDLLGERGATLCSQDEIIAMAAIVKHTVVVPRMLHDARRFGGVHQPETKAISKKIQPKDE